MFVGLLEGCWEEAHDEESVVVATGGWSGDVAWQFEER
jgi:hypothetical protein